MTVRAEGRAGEEWARLWLKDRGYRVFQPDWIAEDLDGHYTLVEVKNQALFMPPPFFGHGLPPYQVRDRLRFGRATGVPALLLVRDKESGESFHQFLDVLEEGPKFMTNGASPRVVYPLTSFEGGEAT